MCKLLFSVLLKALTRMLRYLPGQPLEIHTFYALKSVSIEHSSENESSGNVREGHYSDIDALVRCMDKRERFLERFIAGDHCLIALDADIGEIVGYLWFSVRDEFIEDQSSYKFTIQNNAVYYYDVYVSPYYRQHGLLKQLISELSRWMHENSKDTIQILVECTNVISMKAHLNNGFHVYMKILCVRALSHNYFKEITV